MKSRPKHSDNLTYGPVKKYMPYYKSQNIKVENPTPYSKTCVM